ncbi:SNW1 [Mytilus coruscus]|uniref:SNW1 n=1 Tax=Mytilus coruscus TaxID=42192 RepID=A0A6J8AUH5_MYTCO|nr:SNW1 [Mytilus coruscus]
MAMKLVDILPTPVQRYDREDEDRSFRQQMQIAPVTKRTAPPYGHRKGWIPRTQDDFGDGGAFPEIHVAQYPLSMGMKKSTSNALQVQLGNDGKIKYDAIAKYGHAKDKVVHSKFQDLVPKAYDEDDPEIQKPDEEQIQDTTEATRQALEKLVNTKISAAMPVKAADKQAPAQYIRYTPSQQGMAFNSGAKQRVIRMVEVQKDPMEPPKFKTNKKIPRGPPSPPAPVMHSPNRKVTVKEQQEWKIPPCISNWKNAKGYTIPLDKRLAADGRGLQDRKAREEVEMRVKIDEMVAQEEKKKKEEKLRQLAQEAREERAGIRSRDHKDKNEDLGERDDLRRERQRERQRDRNLSRAAPDKRSRLQRERERDHKLKVMLKTIKKIALGMPISTTGAGKKIYKNHGMDSGFNEDDAYNVYDKPFRQESSIANNIYRPSKNVDKDIYGDDFDSLMKTNRFVPDREFAGTDRNRRREGPVQFEQADEEDPFNLTEFLKTAKRGEKRAGEDSRSSRDYDGSKSKQKRRE